MLTHLDFDHAGGLADFPRAKVHVHAKEMDAALARRTFNQEQRYRSVQFERGPAWETYETLGESWLRRIHPFIATEAIMATIAAHPSPHPFPFWFVRSLWQIHRAAYAISGGRLVLRTPAADRWGMLRLTTVGRRSARPRSVIVGYIEDGPNLITPAMNGWFDPEPAWWLNLKSNPHATVQLPGGIARAVTARAADADERQRLWRRLVDLGTAAYTDASAAARARETAIVILEPAPSGAR